MSCEIVGEDNGVLTVKITGKLKQSELSELQKKAFDIISPLGKAGVLIVATDFHGWDKSCDWGDLERQFALDPLIRKMAIVGDQKWESLTLLFTAKGLRRFPIEYFEPADILKAVSWVGADAN